MKNLLKLGRALNKAELKVLNGGKRGGFGSHDQCNNEYYTCNDGTLIWVGPCHWPHIAPC